MKNLKYYSNDLDKTIKQIVDFAVEGYNIDKARGNLCHGRAFVSFTGSSLFYRDFYRRQEIRDGVQAEFDRRMGRHIELDFYVEDIPAPRWHYRAFFAIAPFTWDY